MIKDADRSVGATISHRVCQEQRTRVHRATQSVVRQRTSCTVFRRSIPDEKRFFPGISVPVLTRRADCSLVALKPAHSSRLLPGTPPSPCASNDIDDEFFNWQMWAVNVVAELLQASNLQGPLAWERFGLGLIPCIEAAGGTRRLARLAGIGHDRLCQWINNKRVPSFKSVLECCYTLGISPLQAMASDPAALKEILGEKTTGRTLHFDKRMCRSVDREREKSYKR